jgi:hypothetical protein
MNLVLGEVSQIIQLAIAPAFLLAGVGTKLMVLTNRLARIIDRSRILEERLELKHNPEYITELAVLYDRWHLIHHAITLSTTCGLMVCLVIASLFVGDTFNLAFGQFIAALFVLGMLALIGSFTFLLREIFVATRSLSRHFVPVDK